MEGAEKAHHRHLAGQSPVGIADGRRGVGDERLGRLADRDHTPDDGELIPDAARRERGRDHRIHTLPFGCKTRLDEGKPRGDDRLEVLGQPPKARQLAVRREAGGSHAPQLRVVAPLVGGEQRFRRLAFGGDRGQRGEGDLEGPDPTQAFVRGRTAVERVVEGAPSHRDRATHENDATDAEQPKRVQSRHGVPRSHTTKVNRRF
ncbi:hypothetical protein [Aureimonas pseudogalii]|uniref:Uncharacterized protein n=1 Tax=Aureimonas pseudogalii TaxID=1744844 RepID=A0A7W6EBP1_9HYPH|nr:hypothetical protein [Aureimonas pseudogalii]MBB3997914.1 hypothetical protein [Aureimonas pseudogalii]